MAAGILRYEGARGKSEHCRAGCFVTRSPGDRQESATENIPPRFDRGKGEKVR